MPVTSFVARIPGCSLLTNESDVRSGVVVPHIGHLYTTVLSDTIARWHRAKGKNVIFSTGTDEHGLKIQQAAEINKKSPQQHCDHISNQFKCLFERTNIDNTDFVRTTENRHRNTVHHFWNCLNSRGHIYRGSYKGWYSTSDEAFVPQNQVSTVTEPDGTSRQVSAETGQPVEWIQEDNYMFPLSKFKDDLLYWLKGQVVFPHIFGTNVQRMVESDLPDLSVSRSTERLHWGIPVPGDPSQTIYVWLDALVNYLTVVGYPDSGNSWPADCHVVGKDILKFHAVYWPAFLMAAGLEPPRQILCHSHWLVDGIKMSKSRGNVVDPVKALNDYTPDGVRYFLMREGVLHHDGNFSTERVTNILNSELANTFGNLLSRCTSNKINHKCLFPKFDQREFEANARQQDKEMWSSLRQLPDIAGAHYENGEISKAIDTIMSQLRSTNNFVEYHRPWDLAKSSKDSVWLSTLLHVTMETLRVSAILLGPVIPTMSQLILNRLGVPDFNRNVEGSKQTFEGGYALSTIDKQPAFPRLKDE